MSQQGAMSVPAILRAIMFGMALVQGAVLHAGKTDAEARATATIRASVAPRFNLRTAANEVTIRPVYAGPAFRFTVVETFPAPGEPALLRTGNLRSFLIVPD